MPSLGRVNHRAGSTLVMQARYYTLSVCILLLVAGCSISSDSGDPQPLNILSTPDQAPSDGVLRVTPSSTVPATRTPVKTAVAPSKTTLKTPPPTVNPSYSLQVEVMESPDHEWIAQTTFEQEIFKGYHVQFTVSRKDGTKTWTIMDYREDGVGYTYSQLHQWSNDSQYLYFTRDRVAGGGCDFFPVDSQWQRLHVDTGQVNDFLLPLGRGHAISPDGSTIVYASPDAPLYLSLYDIQSGQEEKVPLPIDPNQKTAQAGDILWTPDGRAVLLSIATGDACSSSRPNFYLMRVEINTRKIIELVGNSQDLLRPLRLEQPNHVLIRDWNGYTWCIDATSG
jgi:hypothetical protein